MEYIPTPTLSKDLPNLSIHGSHNAAVVLEYKGRILEIIEFERFFDSKNLGYCQYTPAQCRRYAAHIIQDYIKDKYNFEKFGTIMHQHCDANDDTFTQNVQLFNYNELFDAEQQVPMAHHASHAAGCFYQSNFDKAIAFSFDGGGNDGWFNVYLCDRREGVKLIDKHDRLDLGFAYMVFGDYLEDIRKEPALSLGNLVYAGKILGYQSYGECQYSWYDAMKEFYLSKPNGTNYEMYLKILGEKIDITFDPYNRLKGLQAQNLAATSQRVFEDIFLEMAEKYVKEYDYPICMAGGIATGMMLHCLKPNSAYDTSYLGIPAMDKNMLPRYIERRQGNRVHMDCIVDDLVKNKILGVVQNNSEHGPRALGNRSIICSAINPDMKDILNKKVKDREWYRPFAPIVRLEDVSEYFEWEGSSEFMSFCPQVRQKYRSILPSITHIDGTARVQTVTRDKNPFIYDLLTKFKERTNVGVLINTSFNVNGQPILSSYSEAFQVYDRTELDCLYLDGWYFRK